MKKFFYIFLIIISVVGFFTTSLTATFASGNNGSSVNGVTASVSSTSTMVEKGRPCIKCGAPQVKIPVKCKLASLSFTQAEVGPVAIRLYKIVGYKTNGEPIYKVIYDRYKKDRMFVKQKRDTYSLCASYVSRADKVTITRCTRWVSIPMTFVGDVLQAFRRSMKRPVKLPL